MRSLSVSAVVIKERIMSARTKLEANISFNLSRKKARCPGEKPTCSLCGRLGQRCTYGSQEAPNRIRDRSTFANDENANLDGSVEVCFALDLAESDTHS